MIGGHGQVSVQPNGKFVGYFPDSISLFNDYINMQPKFSMGRAWDEIVTRVHNGTYDIGVHTTPTPQRASLVLQVLWTFWKFIMLLQYQNQWISCTNF